MDEIPDAWMPVVSALLEAPIAWQTPAEMAAALDRDVEATTDLLCLMDVAGWLEVWDCDPEPRVTLSALAAARLNLHLVEVGVDEVPRWARVGDPPPPGLRAQHVSTSEHAASLDYLPDLALTPDLAAEQAEQAARTISRIASTSFEDRRYVKVDDLPVPTVLIGQSLIPWPGPRIDLRHDCPACGCRPLAPHMYCLCCDRWGMDRLLGSAAAPARTPARRKRPQPSPEERLRREHAQFERERARRKARRKARHQAQVEAEKLRTQRRATPGGRGPASVPAQPAETQDGAANPASSSAAR